MGVNRRARGRVFQRGFSNQGKVIARRRWMRRDRVLRRISTSDDGLLRHGKLRELDWKLMMMTWHDGAEEGRYS